MGYHMISLAEAVAFNGLFRVVWSIGVGCVILSCALGYGGKKVIFSHKNAFQVLNIVDRRKFVWVVWGLLHQHNKFSLTKGTMSLLHKLPNDWFFSIEVNSVSYADRACSHEICYTNVCLFRIHLIQNGLFLIKLFREAPQPLLSNMPNDRGVLTHWYFTIIIFYWLYLHCRLGKWFPFMERFCTIE